MSACTKSIISKKTVHKNRDSTVLFTLKTVLKSIK